MAIEKKVVVRSGYESFYEDAQNRLSNLNAKINERVEEFRAKVVEEVKGDKERLENIVAMCTEEVEVEVPETEGEGETPAETETEQQ